MPAPEQVDITIVPAFPGFRLLLLFGSEENRTTAEPWEFENIVAWRITTFRSFSPKNGERIWSDVEPIASSGESSNDHFIVKPDGSVDWPEIASYRTIEEALTEYRKQRASA